jgi:hypothetical protein
MADAAPKTLADAMYPGGVNTVLGNQSPDKVLSTYSGNHIAALLWGEPQHREAYVAKYGYEQSLDTIDKALAATPKETKEQKDWHEDMEQYKADLLGRQGS